MFKFLFMLTILSLNSYADDPHPHAPLPWVEIHSIQPVILTWVKALPDKDIEEVPTFMVQKFPKDEKFRKFLKAHKSDSSGCFNLSTKEWEQTWCERKYKVMSVLMRGQDKDSVKIKEQLKSWVLSHD
jgi:hypothetical protein